MITEKDTTNYAIDRIENKQKKVIWYIHHNKYPLYIVSKHYWTGMIRIWIRSIIYQLRRNKKP